MSIKEITTSWDISTSTYLLNNIYKLIVEINEKMTEIDELLRRALVCWNWRKGFSFKHKIHNCLREEENGLKSERGCKSSGSRSKSSGSIRSTGSRSSRMPSKEKTIQEKLRVAELRTEASFMKKKRRAELPAESLRLEEEMGQAEARMKIYEREKLEAKVQSEKVVVTEESKKTRKYTWDGPLLKEHRSEEEIYDPERQASKGQENR